MAVYDKVGLIDIAGVFNKVIDRSITSIDEIDLSEVTEIRQAAFSYCTELTNVVLPNNIQYLNNEAFEYCTSLTSIVLPESILGMYMYVFGNCSSLTSVTILATTPPATHYGSSTMFSNTPIENGTGYIYVPASSVDAYKAARGWQDYASQIRAI